MKIENRTLKLLLILIVSVGIISCSKRAVPSSIGKSGKHEFDSSAFQYIYIEAIKQKLLGNNGDALKYLEQCILINPKSDAAYFQIAQIAVKRGDINNGKKYALKSVEINEKNLWYLTLLGNIFYQEKNIDSSLLFYEKALNIFPEQESLRLTIGNLYSEKGDYNKAYEYYDDLEAKYGVNESSTIFLVRTLINNKRYSDAQEKVLALLNISPDETTYNELLAEIYQAKGEKDNAIKVYQNLMEKDPGNPLTQLSLTSFLISINEFNEMLTLLNGLILNEKISREDKVGIFAKIIENDSIVSTKGREVEIALLVLEANYKGDPLIVLLRPELYEKIKDINKAIQRLEEIIKEMPDSYYAWEKLLILYSEINDYEKLFVQGRECATRFNRSYVAKILYASAAMEKNELGIAEEELRKAEILAGDEKEILVQIFTMQADLLYRKKEYDKSFELYEKALKLSPEDPILLNNYAYFLAEQNRDLTKAEKMSKSVIDIEKENGTYLDTYAWILYKRGKVKEAVKIMDQIIKNGNKEDADWCEHYGFMMKAIKKCELAKEYWNKAIILDSRKSNLKKEIENCIR